jgi:hypothetical protein
MARIQVIDESARMEEMASTYGGSAGYTEQTIEDSLREWPSS